MKSGSPVKVPLLTALPSWLVKSTVTVASEASLKLTVKTCVAPLASVAVPGTASLIEIVSESSSAMKASPTLSLMVTSLSVTPPRSALLSSTV